jgi:mono/diheme cytochrome c family protein
MRREKVRLATITATLSAVCLAVLASCIQVIEAPVKVHRITYGPGWISTYSKYLPLAEAGEADHQNLLGYMLFFGEGITRDREMAHYWFHQAAAQGHSGAQRNLAMMHGLGAGVTLNEMEARRHAEDSGATSLEELIAAPDETLRAAEAKAGRMPAGGQGPPDGAAVYSTYCAGCHGVNGIAAYVDSPSFALGERMDKPDGLLLNSIGGGKGVMPAWDNKLSPRSLKAVLAFLRTLEERYLRGIGEGLRAYPNYYFLFGPMKKNHSAFERIPE